MYLENVLMYSIIMVSYSKYYRKGSYNTISSMSFKVGNMGT